MDGSTMWVTCDVSRECAESAGCGRRILMDRFLRAKRSSHRPQRGTAGPGWTPNCACLALLVATLSCSAAELNTRGFCVAARKPLSRPRAEYSPGGRCLSASGQIESLRFMATVLTVCFPMAAPVTAWHRTPGQHYKSRIICEIRGTGA